MGLQPGDVVTAINGAGMSDGEQIMNALEQIIAGSAIQATIRRGGQARSFTLDSSFIAAEHPSVPEGHRVIKARSRSKVRAQLIVDEYAR